MLQALHQVTKRPDSSARDHIIGQYHQASALAQKVSLPPHGKIIAAVVMWSVCWSIAAGKADRKLCAKGSPKGTAVISAKSSSF